MRKRVPKYMYIIFEQWACHNCHILLFRFFGQILEMKYCKCNVKIHMISVLNTAIWHLAKTVSKILLIEKFEASGQISKPLFGRYLMISSFYRMTKKIALSFSLNARYTVVPTILIQIHKFHNCLSEKLMLH